MSKVRNVVITDRFDADALGKLKSSPDLDVVHEPQFTYKSASAANAEVLVIRSGTKVTAELLDRCPKLKAVITATNGFDHIDLVESKKRNVSVFYCPAGNRDSAVELTWALVLACARKILQSHKSVLDKKWERNSLYGVELSNKIYGVVGLGRIGSRVSKIANAFGMRVMAYDPYLEDASFQAAGAERTGFIELLRMSDVISLHVPYTRETHHMINRNTLVEMQTHTIFINTSRGMVVRETDLSEILLHKDIAAAGLDVFEREPLASESLLLNLPNVVLTPHIGANTTEAFHKVSLMAAEKVLRFVSGNDPGDQLPPTEPWYNNPKGFNS